MSPRIRSFVMPTVMVFWSADAVNVSKQVGAKLTLLTHMCHELDHATTEAELPESVRLGYDGLQIEVKDGAWHKA